MFNNNLFRVGHGSWNPSERFKDKCGWENSAKDELEQATFVANYGTIYCSKMLNIGLCR